MTDAVKKPLLQHGSPGAVGLNGTAVFDAADGLAADDLCLEMDRGCRLSNDLVGIHGVDRLVGIAMKGNGRNDRRPPGSAATAALLIA